MKILVVKPTALGDVAQALLVAPLLKKKAGCQELVWLIDEDYEPLLCCSPLVDRALLFPRRRWKRQGCGLELFRWLRELRREKFDLVLDLQGLARSGIMTWATGAPQRWGLASAREASCLAYNQVVADTAKHAVDRYAQAVAAVLGLESIASHTYLSAAMGELPAGLALGSYTVLHPYSLWPGKMWAWENYQHLVEALPDERFVLVGRGSYFPVLSPNVLDLRNRTDLSQLLVVLSQSRAVVSTDSGPLHLAAAFGRPVLGLFGPTSMEKTGARSTRGIMLQGVLDQRKASHREKYPTGVQVNLSVAEVAQAWSKLVQPA
jgi:heptosyltransferase I